MKFDLLPSESAWNLQLRGAMRILVTAMLAAALGTGALWAQSSATTTKEQEATMEAARKMAIRAMHFSQGDAVGLNNGRASFTEDGWKEFMKHLNGFLDDKGAPTFTSDFAPSGKAVFVGEEDGIVHFKIPGTLTQTSGKSTTTYGHAQLDVTAGGTPVKITRLEQVLALH